MTGAAADGGGLGVNYGTVANNLPSPLEVARFLQSTSGPVGITKVKLFDADPSILTAFANTGIEIVIGISNADIVQLGNRASTSAATLWVQSNVAAYLPATYITGIAVGNEVFATRDKAIIAHLLPAMQNLHSALITLNLSSLISVSSPFTLGILHTSIPPSASSFRRPSLIKAMLSFLANTSSPFMANVYPFFGYLGDPNPSTLEYALFNSSTGYTDPLTNLHYTNMFDAQLDALYSAMAQLGFSNISIMVTETGWPSLGDPDQPGVNLLNAQTYNNNLIKHVSSKQGTPLRPHRSIDTYIFALFNEDMKPGPISERNYGLFKPDMMPVYSTVLSVGQVSLHSSPNNHPLLTSTSSPVASPPPLSAAANCFSPSLLVLALLWAVLSTLI